MDSGKWVERDHPWRRFHEWEETLPSRSLDRVIDELGGALSHSDIVESYEAMKRSVRR